MDEYYFIYKDAHGAWRPATNPTFIAKHTYCRAIPKEALRAAGFSLIADFVWEFNGYGKDIIDFSALIEQYELC